MATKHPRMKQIESASKEILGSKSSTHPRMKQIQETSKEILGDKKQIDAANGKSRLTTDDKRIK